MKISASAAYCILDTVGGSILTKNGNLTVPFLLEMPEAYSLDASEIEQRHQEFFRAFQYIRFGLCTSRISFYVVRLWLTV